MAVPKNTATKKKAPVKSTPPKKSSGNKSSGRSRTLRTSSPANGNSSSSRSAPNKKSSTNNTSSKKDDFRGSSELKSSKNEDTSAADRFKAGFGFDEPQESKNSDPTKGLAQGFQSDMQSFAKDNPSGLNDVLNQAFPEASGANLDTLRQQAANGELNLPANVSFASAEQLNGANAAYSPDNKGTVLLAESLRDNPEQLRKAYAEEVGHHFDQQLNGGKDSKGDEGQIFQEGLEQRGGLSNDRLQTLRAEDDKNTAEIGGVQKEVENSRPETSRPNQTGSIAEPKQTEPADTAKPNQAKVKDPGFQYDGVPHVDHTASIDWEPGSNKMSPTQANDDITANYAKLNESMQRYLAGDPNGPELPPLADWTTFGKYASREAGEQIRNLEDVALAKSGDPAAARRIAQNMTGEEAIPQAVGMGLGHAQDIAENAANPLQAGKEIAEAWKTPDTMLDALVRGNNGIYDNFAPAYDAFLRGEANGGKGLEELEKAGYGPSVKGKEGSQDRQGFIYDSLAKYKEARELGLQAQQETDPAKRKELLDKRTGLVSQANLDLGNQEQMEVIQRGDIFGKREVSENIQAIGGTMAMHDANGTHKLLPNGGDWSDFATRMGYKEVPQGTPGSQQIKDLDGNIHTYKVDPGAKGSISDYFNNNTTGPNAEKLNSGQPRPLYEKDLSDSQLAGRVTAAAPRAASDLTDRASDNIASSSSRLQQQGQAMDAAGQAIGGPAGALVSTVGKIENLVGEGGEAVSDLGHAAANHLETAGDVAEVVVPLAIDTAVDTARQGARATDEVGQGFTILGDQKIRQGQRTGGVRGAMQQAEGHLERMTGEAIQESVDAARATYHGARAAAPIVYRESVCTINNGVQAAKTTARAVKKNISNRVMPWDPRAKWAFGLSNPFAN